MNKNFEVSENEKYGGVLIVKDLEFADEFDDFLNEECYVFSEVKFEEGCAFFYFGQVSCKDKIVNLVERFLNEYL